MTALRIAQWSSGGLGAICARAIQRRPGMTLDQLWVHSADKVGRDVGELVGDSAWGITATNDKQAIIAAQPDCICYTASGESRPQECVEDFCDFLRAGINVVTTSIPGLVHSTGFDPEALTRLRAACDAGGASLYGSGLEPGFAGDHFPLVLATLSDTLTSIRIQELFSYDEYAVPFVIYDLFGFGRPPEQECIMQLPGVQRSAWEPPVRMLADHLGVNLDGIRETYEKRTTDTAMSVAAGDIPAGTVAAVRFETIGVVDGEDAIVIEHVNRLGSEIAPDWPSASRDGTYRILMSGSPDIHCDLHFGSPDTFTEHGMIATAMRVVNAIPYVCAAAPGLVTSQDLPLTLPTHAFSPAL